MERQHKATVARTSDPFEQTLSGMIGLPNGAHTQPAAIQVIDFYGHATAYIVQTVRTEDEGVSVFVTEVGAGGTAQRFILPQVVLATIDRQRDAITTKLRRRNGQRIAEARKAAGLEPGFATKRKGTR